MSTTSKRLGEDAPQWLAKDQLDDGASRSLPLGDEGSVARSELPRCGDRTALVLSAIVEGSIDAIFAKDSAGRYVLFNAAAGAMVGLEPAAVMGNDDYCLFDAASAQCLRECDQHVMNAGRSLTREEMLVVKGESRLFLVTKSPYRNCHGEIDGVVGIARDITEQRADERRLRENALRLADAESMAHMGYWARDFVTDRSTWSDETYRIYGLSPEDGNISSNQSVAAIHPDDRPSVLDAVEKAKAGDGKLDIAYRLVRPNGEVRYIHSRGTIERDAQGNPASVVGILQDVTEREQLFRENQASRTKLAELSRCLASAHESERRRIAHELHDDIGQIFTVVNLKLASLKPHVGPEAAEQIRQCSEIVNRAIAQVRELSLNLWPASLEMLGLEAALAAYVNRSPVDGQPIVKLTSSLHNRRLLKTIEVVCFRVVQKAWTNVLRHASAKHCWIGLSLDDINLEVTIRDDGIGFAVDDAWRRGWSGGGLGLVGMREYVQLLGGSLDVQSSPGKGTSVIARFPALQED
jgi:PAS domain S-box-containing protein